MRAILPVPGGPSAGMRGAALGGLGTRRDGDIEAAGRDPPYANHAPAAAGLVLTRFARVKTPIPVDGDEKRYRHGRGVTTAKSAQARRRIPRTAFLSA